MRNLRRECGGILIGAALSCGGIAAAQTQTALATLAPTRAAAPDLSTPQKAASAYYKALTEEDGTLLLACVDLGDENVKKIITARAGQLESYRHYRLAAEKAFGKVPEQFLPPSLDSELLRMVMGKIETAEVVVKGERATVTPKLGGWAAVQPGEESPDAGPMFQMSLVKSGETWRVVLQDSAAMFKMDLDGSARAMAEQTAAESPEVEAVAGEIGKGTYADAQTAWAELRKRKSAADRAVEARWKAAKDAAQGTVPAGTRP